MCLAVSVQVCGVTLCFVRLVHSSLVCGDVVDIASLQLGPVKYVSGDCCCFEVIEPAWTECQAGWHGTPCV